jgi:rhamnogalacturonyl hydrolase YesR
MFIYSFLEGYKKGWLSEIFKDGALRAFEGLKEKIDKQRNIYGTCIGTSTQNTLEDYYKRATPENDWHGQGPAILAACAAASVLRQSRDKIQG